MTTMYLIYHIRTGAHITHPTEFMFYLATECRVYRTIEKRRSQEGACCRRTTLSRPD